MKERILMELVLTPAMSDYHTKYWIIELFVENEVFTVARHYGSHSKGFRYCKDFATDDIETALHFFHKKLTNKLNKSSQSFQVPDGYQIINPPYELMNILGIALPNTEAEVDILSAQINHIHEEPLRRLSL